MPVVVESYNPEWPVWYEKIKKELEHVLQGIDYHCIEHVGSTSVVGMAAKPILDIDIVVPLEHLQSAIDALRLPGTGLVYMGELGIQDRHAFRAPLAQPTRNLYVCVQNSSALRNHLAVRDLLRQDANLRRQYSELKERLANGHLEIHEYMKQKNDFVIQMLKLSGRMSENEIDEICTANGIAKRINPVKTAGLVLREFVIGDGQSLHQSGLRMPQAEAQDVVVEIIQNAGKTPRIHTELAVVSVDAVRKEAPHLIGRVGLRLLTESVNSCDQSLARGLEALRASKGGLEHVLLVYVFVAEEAYTTQLRDLILGAFIPAACQDLMSAEELSRLGKKVERAHLPVQERMRYLSRTWVYREEHDLDSGHITVYEELS
ncbi:hypothetical protein BKA63DRAFT_66887 [Paraphoma chrysanthemicola]|nr:hypothetical protein BKA63DRAFT_66887 [Paraphoma chrysanthemicola]